MSSPTIDSVVLLDEDEQPVRSRELLGPISADRCSVWSSRLFSECDPPITPADNLIAVRCVGGRGLLEHVVRVPPGGGEAAAAIVIECRVSCEELPPSSLVEYRFTDGDGKWRLSMVCLEYLLAFRSGKFADWEKRVLAPTCAAEFRRMVSIGPVFQVYDHHMFPSTEDEKGDYEITNDRGRKVILPRPVGELRIWSTEKQAYEAVDPTLDGCPVPEERAGYWTGVLEKLRVQFPEEVEEILGTMDA